MREAANTTRTFASEIKSAQNTLHSSSNMNTRFASNIQSMNRQVENYSNTLQKLKQRQKDVGQTLRESTTNMSRMESSITKQRSTVDRLGKEWLDYRQELDKANNKVEEARQKKNQLRQAMEQNENATDEEKQAVKEATAEWKRYIQEQKEAKAAVDQAKNEYKQANDELKVHEKALGSARREVDALEKEYGELTPAMAKVKAEQAELNREMERQTQAYIKAGGIYADRAKSLDEFGQSAQKVGSAIKGVGNDLTSHVTLPLVAVGTAAATVGVRFEQQMSKVAAISQATGSELSSLTEQAKTLGADTIFSATEVAQGMELMASAGFNATEIMSAMPGVLDLAAVSGGDVALASETAAVAINAFGLEMSETGHVADVFAKAAADTNAEVEDMGDALTYAAPVASALGISIEETAAAIGVMSDAGVKGSQAGTSLRGALSRLAKPTKQMQTKMDELGVSFFDAQGKMLPLGDIIGLLQSSFVGLTDEQRQNALVTLFGQNALSGMMALVNAGQGELDGLTESLTNSDGAAKEMADTMQDNLAGTLEEMMGALETAAIELTGALAPAITDVANVVADLARDFSELSDEQQMNILKWAGIAAASGPVLKVLGSGISVVGGLSKGMSFLTRTVGGYKTAAMLAGTATTTASTQMTTLATTATTAAGAGGVGALKTALAVGLPWALGIAATAMASYGIWKLWGEDAWNASQDTREFGGVVGEVGGEIISEFNEVNEQVSNAHGEMAVNAEAGAEKAKQAYGDLASSITGDLSKVKEESEATFNELPENVRKALESAQKEFSAGLDKQADVVQSYSDTTNKIYDRASEEKRQLTAEELSFVEQTTAEMYRIEIENANMTSEEKANALRVYNLEYDKMSKAQLDQEVYNNRLRADATRDTYEEELKVLQEHNDEIGASTAERLASEQALRADYKNQNIQNAAELVESLRASGLEEEQILNTLGNTYGQFGIGIADVNQYIQEVQEDTASMFAVTTEEMSDNMVKANDTWNGLLFENKIAKLDSNARETLIEIGHTEEGWDNLLFTSKEANIDDNTREFIGDTMMANHRWYELSWEERQALMRNNMGENTQAFLEAEGLWNDLDLEEQEAILNSNSSEEVEQALKDAGVWNSLTLEQKEAIVTTNAGKTVQAYLENVELWDDVSPEAKEAILTSNSGETMKEALINSGIWNELAWTTKIAMVETNAGVKAREAMEALGIWNSLEPEVQMFIAESNLDDETINLMTYHDLWNNTTFMNKLATIDTNAPDAKQQVEELIEQWTGSTLEEKNGQVTVTEFGVEKAAQDVNDYNREVGLMTETKYGKVQVESNVDQHVPNLTEWNNEMSILPPEKYSSVFTETNAPFTQKQLDNASQSADTLDGKEPNVGTRTDALTTKGKMDSASAAADYLNTKSPHITTSTTAPTTKGKLDSASGSADTLDAKSPYVSASTNASSVESEINSARDSAQDKKFTITGVFKKIGDWWDAAFNATGNPYFAGGATWLGDGGKREPYLTPSGMFGVSGNKDELHSLPKGTRIWPSRQSFRQSAKNNSQLQQYMDMLPKFATGGTIENPYNGYTGLVGEAGPEIFQIANGKVSITPISQSERTKVLDSNNGNSDMSETNNLLGELIRAIATSEFTGIMNVNGREVGKAVFPFVENQLSINTKLREGGMR